MEITKEQKVVVASILRDFMDEIEHYFTEAPIDYQDRKDGFEEVILGILEDPIIEE